MASFHAYVAALRTFSLTLVVIVLSGCGASGEDDVHADMPVATSSSLNQLRQLVIQSSPKGLSAYRMPDGSQLSEIPQSPNNPLTPEKVALGAALFHETGLADQARNPDFANTYSCATCHHVDAGFKAGVPQGIGEGGVGFGKAGEARRLSPMADPNAPQDHMNRPDIQPVASPTILNTTYQSVMLWNGQFGNEAGDTINANIDLARLQTADTPKEENARGLPGLEIQAIAGLGVHRLNVTDASLLQTNSEYQTMFNAAYPEGSSDPLQDAGKAIAAYERTVLSNLAPFQRWLNGDANALTERQVRGAILFFGIAGCSACHRGPALSSELGASASEVFFAIGFDDFDISDPRVHGRVPIADSLGRGGFTGNPAENFQFKIPQLYNLADADVLGHGASFQSVREVIEYKNRAEPQKIAAQAQLDHRFKPLNLTDAHIDDLVAFVEEGLYDSNLSRYVPATTPSENCFPVNDAQSQSSPGC